MDGYSYPASEEMVERYEQLRSTGMDGNRRSHNLGMALFCHRGMAAWMKAWSSCPATPKVPEVGSSRYNLKIPGEVQSNIVTILAGMILGHRREIRQ